MASLTILPIEKIKSTPFVDKNGNAAFYRLLADARGMDWDTVYNILHRLFAYESRIELVIVELA